VPTTGAAVTPNPPGATVNHQRANTYDLRGNRTQVAGPGWNQVMQYDPEDRLFFEQRNGLPIQYTWENRGSLATKNAAGQLTTYENDYLGRMTGYQTATAHVRDTYAPTGQRIAHIDQLGVAPEEWYLPDGLETLADYTKQGANPEQYDGIYAAAGLDGKAARVNAAGQATYFFQDALGSVGQVIDQAGAVVRTNFTDAWGANLAVGLPAPPVGLGGRWGYTGREKDEVSGLMHYRARTYDPAVGRFISRDPVWHSNLYMYVLNGPTNLTDPMGQNEDYGFSAATGAAPMDAPPGVGPLGGGGGAASESPPPPNESESDRIMREFMERAGGVSAGALAFGELADNLGTSAGRMPHVPVGAGIGKPKGARSPAGSGGKPSTGAPPPNSSNPHAGEPAPSGRPPRASAPKKPDSGGGKGGPNPAGCAGKPDRVDAKAAGRAGNGSSGPVPRVKSSTLRNLWERTFGKKWPKDPKNPTKNQDVSHEKPLADGGTNDVDNLSPKPHEDHMREHMDRGDFKRWGGRAGPDRNEGTE